MFTALADMQVGLEQSPLVIMIRDNLALVHH
jgi:hypothetical protein